MEPQGVTGPAEPTDLEPGATGDGQPYPWNPFG